MIYTSYPEKSIASVIEEPGKYYCLYIVKFEGYNVHTQLCTYKVTDPTFINDNLLESGYFINDGIVNIYSTPGDKIELYTLEGIKLYSFVAVNNKTIISGLSENQILILKKNG